VSFLKSANACEFDFDPGKIWEIFTQVNGSSHNRFECVRLFCIAIVTKRGVWVEVGDISNGTDGISQTLTPQTFASFVCKSGSSALSFSSSSSFPSSLPSRSSESSNLSSLKSVVYDSPLLRSQRLIEQLEKSSLAATSEKFFDVSRSAFKS
jgi:hypothetical protein